MSGSIWIEVDDLVDHISRRRRPSGIQRLEYELCKALVEFSPNPTKVNFIAFDDSEEVFRVLDWSELSRLFDDVANSALKPGTAASVKVTRQNMWIRPLWRRMASRLPPPVRYPLAGVGTHQLLAIRSFLALWQNLGLAILVRLRRRLERSGWSKLGSNVLMHEGRPAWKPEPGDVLVSFGASWRPEHPGRIEKARSEHRLRYAMLFHDIIPLRRPEWVDPDLVAAFSSWVPSILPLADVVLTNSMATASDVKQYANGLGLDVSGRIHTIPIGTGFSKPRPIDWAEDAQKRPLPAPGSYILVVSTVEPRKNHSLLFRVWRYLLEDLPRDRVPTLVFAGGIGWLMADFLQQMKNANFLDGKIVVVEKPSDAELEALYAGCQYTIYPSFYEGWGLPVTESHAYKRPCLASNRTSIPEAGGNLARYFDPDNAHELYDHVRGFIENPGDLKQWQEQVMAEFKPTSWSESASAILRVL